MHVVRKNILDKFVKDNGVNNVHRCPRIAHMENLFEELSASHEYMGHAKVERTYKEIQTKCSNISRPLVEMFIHVCPRCTLDKSVPSRKLPLVPILSDTFNDRGQVDLIDMQAQPDGEYRWILNYQDHLTKFCHLRALRKKSKFFKMMLIF